MSTKCGTVAVGRRQAEGAFHATRFANDNGRALNLLVTIDFDSLGVEEGKATAAFQQLWRRVGRWWTYQRDNGRLAGPFDALAVHEHPPGGRRHVHWFMREPGDEGLRETIRNRLCKIVGLDCPGEALHFLAVNKPGGVAKYVLKGVEPGMADYFHMEASDQGYIPGRRLAISRSIGRTARQEAHWKRKKRA